MKRSLILAAVFATLALAPGCNRKPRAVAPATAGAAAVSAQPPAPALSPQEVLAQQAIQALNRATELMTSVHDRASAAAAAPELKTLAAQLQDLNRRGVPLGSQVQEQPQALGRFRNDMEKAVQSYADIGVRLVAQENNLGPEMQEALRELGKLPQ